MGQNPVSQTIQIDILNAEPKTLILSDLEGKTVLSKVLEATAQTQVLPVNNLANGLYLLKIQTDNMYQVTKVVVQH